MYYVFQIEYDVVINVVNYMHRIALNGGNWNILSNRKYPSVVTPAEKTMADILKVGFKAISTIRNETFILCEEVVSIRRS
jgi:hypothetical protein